MSSLILRLHLENTKGFSAPHPTRKEQKAFYLKEHSKRYWLQSQTRLLKAADSLNTQPLPLSWDFLQQSLLQALGTQLLLILQSLHNALYQQREQTSTALVLANRTDRPEVNTTAFCVVWKKKLKQVSPTPPPSKFQEEFECADKLTAGLPLKNRRQSQALMPVTSWTAPWSVKWRSAKAKSLPPQPPPQMPRLRRVHGCLVRMRSEALEFTCKLGKCGKVSSYFSLATVHLNTSDFLETKCVITFDSDHNLPPV